MPHLPGPRTALACLTLAACLALAGCSLLPGSTQTTPSPSWAPGTAAAVPSTAPTSEEDYTCPGIPDAALEAMLGTDVTVTATTTDSIIGATCWVDDPDDDSALFASEFGYVYDAHPGPWDQVAHQDSPDLAFDGVEGAGSTSTSDVQDSRTVSAVFVCGDYYLDLDIYLDLDASPTVNGDPEANLVNLTRSALPWLCQGQVVPGLGGQTLEEARPPWAHSSPAPSATPA